jgi:hypothetical protein
MNKRSVLLFDVIAFIAMTFLTSCDGGDGAYIINNCRLPVKITFRQTLVTDGGKFNDTTQQKVKPLELKILASFVKDEYKQLGDYEIKFDSADNSATFMLPPGDKVEIGRTFLLGRDEYENWEFNELEIEFNGGKIFAKNEGIPNLAVKEKHWFGYPDYFIRIGNK